MARTKFDNIFHAAWTRCVREQGYDKGPWSNCLCQLENATRAQSDKGFNWDSDLAKGLEKVEEFVFRVASSGYSSVDWGNVQQQLAQVLAGQTSMIVNEASGAQVNDL